MGNSAVANPLSRGDIRSITKNIRKLMDLDKKMFFPILDFVEIILPQIYEGFEFQVREISEMGDQHGQACPEENRIILREDVYEGVLRGEGRDRFTLAHELGHFLLHRGGAVALARIKPGSKVVTYQDPEWQADAFAGELLMPANLIKGKSAVYVSETCKVSMKAARYQLNKV